MDANVVVFIGLYVLSTVFPVVYHINEWLHHNDNYRMVGSYRVTTYRGAREPKYARRALFSLVWPVWALILLLRSVGSGLWLFLYEAITGRVHVQRSDDA